VSSRARGLAAILLVGAVGYLLFPVGDGVPGVGVLQGSVESLVPVTPPLSGLVSRVAVRPPSPVTTDLPLLAVVPMRDAGILVEASPTKPGGGDDPGPGPPPEIEQASRERSVLASAGQRWISRVRATREHATWEIHLANRLAVAASRAGDLRVVEARTRYNEQRGRFEANLPQVFDPAAGRSQPSTRGVPVAAPAGGTLVSLWAMPMTQVFAGATIGEVLPDGAAMEVIAVVPERAARRLEARGANVRFDDGPWPAVSSVLVARTPIEPADVRLLVPGLEPAVPGVFVRLRLAAAVDPQWLGRLVGYELTIRSRPRLWGWVTGR
jgi:hypothetical protein